LAAITKEIEEWQATFDVETWEELEQSLADGDLTSSDLHERRDVITVGGESGRPSPHQARVGALLGRRSRSRTADQRG